MATRFKSVIAFLAAVMVVTTAACASDPPVPTPNIEATVDARVAQERAVDATVEARVAQERVVDATVEAKAKVEASFPTARFRDSRGNPAVPELPTMPTPTPSHVSIWLKGVDYFNAGKYQLAINEFTTVIRVSPHANQSGFSYNYYFRGVTYSKLGQHQRAIEVFDKAIELNRLYAIAWNSRGVAYRMLGQEVKARISFTGACAIDKQYC